MNERIFNEFAPEVMAALIAKAKKAMSQRCGYSLS